MTDAQDKREAIRNNLEVGKFAKPKMYNTLLNRINKGEILSKKDLETFDELDKELRETYLPGDTASEKGLMPDKDQVFKNALEVELYLLSQGWKIKKSSIYNHIKAHKLIPDAQGQFTRAAVDRYALTNLKKADGSTPQKQRTESDKIAEEAADARRRRELAQAAKLEHELDALKGKLVPRDMFEGELAARAAIFRSDLENFFRGQIPAMVNIVSGDPSKIPELNTFCMDALEEQLSRYLQKEEFKVDVAAYQKIFERSERTAEEDSSEEDPV